MMVMMAMTKNSDNKWHPCQAQTHIEKPKRGRKAAAKKVETEEVKEEKPKKAASKAKTSKKASNDDAEKDDAPKDYEVVNEPPKSKKKGWWSK